MGQIYENHIRLLRKNKADREALTVDCGLSEMTLRDHFAGQALAGILTNGNLPWSVDVAEISDEAVAKACFDLADRMLEARSTSQSKEWTDG